MHCVQGQQQRLAEGKEVRWETMKKSKCKGRMKTKELVKAYKSQRNTFQWVLGQAV